jgi:type I restriction enzyme S subunit
MKTQTTQKWNRVKLGDVADINMGQSPQSKFYNSEGEGLPFMQGVTEFGELFPTIKQWTSKTTKTANVGDILFSVRAPVGRINYSKEKMCIGRGLSAMKAKKQLLFQPFLFYLLKNEQNNFISQSGGSIYDSINKDKLNDFEVKIPDVPTQKQIADVLSTYDNLIEKNTRRIKILEQMAQTIYTEWFVNFRFPGYKKIKMIDSKTEFGKIPEGWETKKLKNIGKVITGKTPSTSKQEFFRGDILFIKTPDIHGNIFILNTEQTLSQKGANSQSSKLLPERTVFVSCIGTLGIVGITAKSSQTNQQINAFVLENNQDYCMFYFFAKNLKDVLLGLGASGATMGNVNKDKFENIEIVYPEPKIRKRFFDTVNVYFDEILNLQKQNANLRRTRDLLLPKLVTGEIRV